MLSRRDIVGGGFWGFILGCWTGKAKAEVKNEFEMQAGQPLESVGLDWKKEAERAGWEAPRKEQTRLMIVYGRPAHIWTEPKEGFPYNKDNPLYGKPYLFVQLNAVKYKRSGVISSFVRYCATVPEGKEVSDTACRMSMVILLQALRMDYEWTEEETKALDDVTALVEKDYLGKDCPNKLVTCHIWPTHCF